MHCRKALDEAHEVEDHRDNLRLLKHRFADEHLVGRDIGLPPGEVAAVRAIPGEQLALECGVAADHGHADDTPQRGGPHDTRTPRACLNDERRKFIKFYLAYYRT